MTTISRRDYLALTLATGAALTIDPRGAFAQSPLLTRAIPSSGELLPVVGQGSSATFSQVARASKAAGKRGG